jgi:hypothetical protein
MRIVLHILTIIILTACNRTDNRKDIQAKDTTQHQIDTSLSNTSRIDDETETDPYDSLANAYVDTSTLQGKRRWIMNQFLVENGLSSPDYDTLIDLTYDGFQDYVIGYYGKSGTGIKNRVKVYLFNSKKQCYILDEQLSDLPNPTFYIKQKKITGFYIGNGGGGGGRLEWINNKWTTTKEFDVDKEGDSTKWNISYPLKK